MNGKATTQGLVRTLDPGLLHCYRTSAGAGPSIEEQVLGPSVYMPSTQYPQQLEDDEKTFDATQLVIHQPATDDVRT